MHGNSNATPLGSPVPHIATKDGTQLYYRDWGAGQPVVFCHGWPLNSDMWEYQMTALASAGFRCIAYDRRGFGRSDHPWTGYDYDTFADDLATLIETLELTNIVLIGFSMGGGDIARYISRHGSTRIAKAVLIASVTPMMVRTPDHPLGVDPAIFHGFRSQITANRPAFLKDFATHYLGAELAGLSLTAPEAIPGWIQSLGLQASAKATFDCVSALSETDFRPDLEHFTMPTLIIHGEHDQIVPLPTTARETARLIPGSRLEVYGGASHGLFLTHKNALNGDLLNFLGE